MRNRALGRARNGRRIIALALLALGSGKAAAHHGVAGLGAAALEGPGAPIEMATSATLPKGSTLLYAKLDHAKYKTFDPDPKNPESDYANYWMLGIGYGFQSWLSGYVFLPYHSKVDEDGGFDTHGFADVNLFGQFGFKYDQGLRLIPENESLDDLEDWHFTLFGGFSLPTGNPNLRDRNGEIDPGKSTGFGNPAYALGLTATKMIGTKLTFNQELSYIGFQEYRYSDGNRTRFGEELRANSSLVYRLYTNVERRLRLDLAIEAHYLHLGRDRTNGESELATGGDMIYGLPGVRLYWDRVSVGLGYKSVLWKDLNEQDEQQGGEGTERYRLILTVSALF